MTLKLALASLQTIILGLIFIFPLIVVGFQKELIIYWREPQMGMREIRQRFSKAVPDTSVFIWHRNVSRYCSKGKWSCFNNKNFSDTVKFSLFPTKYDGETFCETYIDKQGSSRKSYEFPCKSFRPQGGNDTDLTALSLYTEERLAGRELRITEDDLTNSKTRFNNIPQYFGKVGSIAWTGSGNWTIFPQPDFQGLAHCLNGNLSANASTRSSSHRIYRIRKEIEFDGVGSILRGCDRKNFDLHWGNALPTFKKTAGKFLQFGWNTFLGALTHGGSQRGSSCSVDDEGNEICG